MIAMANKTDTSQLFDLASIHQKAKAPATYIPPCAR